MRLVQKYTISTVDAHACIDVAMISVGLLSIEFMVCSLMYDEVSIS